MNIGSVTPFGCLASAAPERVQSPKVGDMRWGGPLHILLHMV